MKKPSPCFSPNVTKNVIYRYFSLYECLFGFLLSITTIAPTGAAGSDIAYPGIFVSRIARNTNIPDHTAKRYLFLDG
jgi:hypothetical protein